MKENTSMKVIFDTDPGNGFPGSDIDDGLALGLLLSSPEIDLLAVTIVNGNTPSTLGQRSALHMLHLAGSTVPVFVGEPPRSSSNARAWREQLDADAASALAQSLWADVQTPRTGTSVQVETAADAIIRLANEHRGELVIVAVGPLTNVAAAFRTDPELPGKLKRIVVMGGSFGVWHHPVELNFGYDPEAAQIVMVSGVPITLVPLDTTLKTTFTLAHAAVLEGSSKPLVRFLGSTCEPWIRWVEQKYGSAGCALHDPLAVAVLLDPSLVAIDSVRVEVELTGPLTRGRPVSWPPDRRGFGAADLPTGPLVDVAVDVDGDRFRDGLLQRLMSA